jgi:hypothetical protein
MCHKLIRPAICPGVSHVTYPVSILTQSPYIMCRISSEPFHPYGRAMCHHCKGDICHSQIGPPVPVHISVRTPSILPCVTSRSYQLHLPCHLYGHMSCTDRFHMALYGLYGLYNHHFFACLAKRIDSHNLSIRRLFEPIQVVLGLY